MLLEWQAIPIKLPPRGAARRRGARRRKDLPVLVTPLPTADKNDYLSARMRTAFSFLREADLARRPLGRADIDGGEVFANVQE